MENSTPAVQVERKNSTLSTVLQSFKDLRLRKPSQCLTALGSQLTKGICTERPIVSDDQLMFRPKDIHDVRNPLAKLFRMIMFKLRMTPDEYKSKTMEYGRSIGKTPAQMNTELSNSKKAIYGGSLTIMQLERNLLHAGYDILDMSLTIKNNTTGEVQTYQLSDVTKLSNHTTDISSIFSNEYE